MTPNSYYEYPYIHLVVKDPSNTTVVDISNYDFWYLRENGYNYTLPSTAPNGTYTISASFNTGPYQGVIIKSTTFSVTSGTTFTLRIPTGWSVISVPLLHLHLLLQVILMYNISSLGMVPSGTLLLHLILVKGILYTMHPLPQLILN